MTNSIIGRALAVIAFMFAFGRIGFAQSQGIDNLQPAPPPPPIESMTSGENGPKSNGAPAVTQPAEPIVRSEISTKIENKLALGTSIGFGTLSGQGTSWNAGFHNQVFASYALGHELKGFSFAGTARYAPLDVAPKIKANSYRGIVESFFFGVEGRKALNANWTAIVGSDLGYLITSLNSNDDLPKDSSAESNGVVLAVAGGIDWSWFQKVKFGPRVRIGVGSFTMFEHSVALSCYF